MKKLSKEQADSLADLVVKLRETYEAVTDKQAEIEEQFSELNELIQAYNEVCASATEFASGIADEIDTFMADKSDKWQEGDNGQRYDTWRSEWQGFNAEELDEAVYEGIDAPSTADDLEALPVEPE